MVDVRYDSETKTFDCGECGLEFHSAYVAADCCSHPQGRDAVNSPGHYTRGGIEAIEAIKASMSSEEFEGYLKANCMKYLWRYRYKGKPEQDLKKARWYLDRLINEIASH